MARTWCIDAARDVCYRRSNPRARCPICALCALFVTLPCVCRADLPEARHAAKELVITGYASLLKLGPRLVAGYVKSDQGGVLNPTSQVQLCLFSEAWQGDLREPLSNMQFDESVFAVKMQEFLVKTAKAGFWHLDATPFNILYRGGVDEFEICWTDFDGARCGIWPYETRVEMLECNILVHAAQILGSMSCIFYKEVFKKYQPAVVQKLNSGSGTRMNDVNASNARAARAHTHNPLTRCMPAVLDRRHGHVQMDRRGCAAQETKVVGGPVRAGRMARGEEGGCTQGAEDVPPLHKVQWLWSLPPRPLPPMH